MHGQSTVHVMISSVWKWLNYEVGHKNQCTMLVNN